MSKMNVELVEKFKSIIKECVNREGIDRLMTWLDSTDFYTAPASTKFHGNFPGGLLMHSLRVYECLKKKQENESDETIALVSLFHDLCKANLYKEYETFDKNGKARYSYKMCNQFPFGHGEKSVLLLSKYIDLTDEEMLAIRWHMGQYCANNMAEDVALQMCLHKYKLTLKLQEADMEASYWYNE